MDDSTRTSLELGKRRDDGASAGLPVTALLRHVMALGSSGSGKTVFCKVVVEEALRAGVPAICIDPQGDLASLVTQGDPELVASHGIDPAAVSELAERMDPVIFTPGSHQGVPLCVDPVERGMDQLVETERVQATSRTAGLIVSLLGYDPDSDDGSGLNAVLDTVLTDQVLGGRAPVSLEDLTAHLGNLDETALSRLARYLDTKKLKTACQRLARLDVGARRLLFHDGLPIDVDLLLGRTPPSAPPPGKTRLSIIYLNTLHDQADKDFFVAALANRLYSWMLRNPSGTPQVLFYLDEVAPFLPPVRKPAAKDPLVLLFKQARKYGVCCLMATQNPGDVDYKAMAQFGTWALGRTTTRQDLRKLAPNIKSLAPTTSDAILQQLPSLQPGQFVLLNPDHYPSPCPLATRWLLTTHATYDDQRIADLTDATGWRDRLLALGAPATSETSPGSRPTPSSLSREAADSEPPPVVDEEPIPPTLPMTAAVPAMSATPLAAAPTPRGAPPTPGGAPGLPPAPCGGPIPAAPPYAAPIPHATPATPPFARPSPLPAPLAVPPPAVALPTAPAPLSPAPPPVQTSPPLGSQNLSPPSDYGTTERSLVSSQPPEHLVPLARILARRSSMSAADFAQAASVGLRKAREHLRALTDAGLACVYAEGRTNRYWAVSTGSRPDLGLISPVLALSLGIDEPAARRLAAELARGKLLGLVGQPETLDEVELSHRLVYKLDFEEMVERQRFGGLLGTRRDQLLGSVYVHPRTCALIVYSPQRGISFDEHPADHASSVVDFDGVTATEECAPAALCIDRDDWAKRRDPRHARERIRKRYAVRIERVVPLFVPLWRLVFGGGRSASRRVVFIDGLAGRPVEWP